MTTTLTVGIAQVRRPLQRDAVRGCARHRLFKTLKTSRVKGGDGVSGRKGDATVWFAKAFSYGGIFAETFQTVAGSGSHLFRHLDGMAKSQLLGKNKSIY